MASLLGLFCENETTQILQQSLNSTAFPLVNECIQHTWLTYIPSLYLLTFFPLLLYDLHTSPNGQLKCQSPITYKLILCPVLAVITGVMLLNGIHEKYSINSDLNGSHLFGLVLLNLTVWLSLVLMIACRNRGVVTSGVLFIYYALLVICGLPELLAHLHKLHIGLKANVHCHLFLIYYLFVFLILCLSCFADRLDHSDKETNKCPELYTSFLNQLTFHWFTSFTVRGYFKGLQLTDMWDLNERDQAPRLVHEFERNYAESVQCKFLEITSAANRKNQQRKRKPKKKKECLPVNGATEEQPLKLDIEPEQKEELPSVFWALARTFKLNLLAGALFKFTYDIVQFSFPQLLKMLISFVEKGTEPIWYGIFVAVSILMLGLVQSLVLHQYFHLMFRTGMNIRSVLTAAVYKKAINLSNKSRKNRTVGSMVNLLAVDVQKFQDITTYAVLIWSAPMQMLLALFFLWRLLGFCVLIGLVILVVLIPINSWISSMTRKCQTEQLECKDRRLRLISEVMNGIKMIKLYGWEKRMKERILEERQKEIQVLRRYAFLQTITSFTWSCAPFLVAVMTFGIYVLIDPENNVLTPQITFVALSLFNILRFPMAVGMIVFTQVIQFSVSNKRVKEFLAADELEPLCLRNSDPQIDFSIVLENASFAWEKDGQPILHDLNAQIRQGTLVAVIGRIGSGKSSLLQALIGEMHRCEGWSALNGQVAYVPQQSWIQNMSVRDNILFGRTYKEGFYETIINGCALSPDMAALPNGDLTEIGEKGVNISGGQKARIAIARSVYADADVYLLDNPLASVDAHVGRSIFENVITGMLANKTRILVTHSLAYLKHCDQIIVMKDGRFSEVGGYEELIQKSGEFSQILKEFLMEEAKNRGRSISFGEDAVEAKEVLAKLEQIIPDEKEPSGNELKPPDDKPTNHLSPNGNTPANNTLNQSSVITTKTNQQTGKTAAATTNPGARLIEGESVETGKVKWSIYLAYIRAIGYAVCAFFIIIFLLSSALGIKSNLWLSDWTDEALQHQKSLMENGTSDVPKEGMSIYLRLGIYTLLGLGQIVFVCLATVLVMLGMVRASWLLHESMLNGVLRSPMSFFDITPLGRILNRFAKDMELVDSRLPGNVLNFAGSIIQALAILCVPIIATPLVIVPFIVILIFYVILTIFYLSTSRQLNRLVAITRSPIYSHFGESIQGASSIRAYGCMDRFVQASQERVDQNLKVYYPSIVANRWLSIRLELIGHLIVFCSALFAVLFRNVDHVTAGLIGLSVSYAQNVTQTLNWAVRTSSELETNIVSIERIQEYADTKTEKQINGTEGEIIISESELWPTAGEIRFENLSMRYRENTEEVLHEINLHIQPGEKIGIIGRTGSGKTTLALSLLRIIEPSAGRILIDNANIAHVKLDTIRARLTVVPQDPVLFSGTIRFNLDPCDIFSEPALWEVIQLVHMGGFVESLPDQLNHQITEGGSNLSVGQRQLICLARALLRKPKILVLDEASASVDLETDSLIHRTIKEQFDGTTVLTIAHRLTFMFDCDRILTMDAGRVVEFDTPQALWADETSVFRQLANESEVPLQNIRSQQTPNIEVTVAEMNSNEKE